MKSGRWWLVFAGLAATLGLTPASQTGEPIGAPQFPRQRLGYWRFNTAEGSNDAGRPPAEVTNVTAASGSDGGALAVGRVARPAWFRVRELEADGHRQFSLSHGSVRFLYQPLWSSVDPFRLGETQWGKGPGEWLRLMEAGTRTATGWASRFALATDPLGSSVALLTFDGQGQAVTNILTRIDWQFTAEEARHGGKPVWRELVVTYTPTNSALIIDGLQPPDMRNKTWGGPGLGPGLPASAEGRLAIGGSLEGNLVAGGLIDELETFDHPITPLRNYRFGEQVALSARVGMDPPSVTLRWLSSTGRPVSLRRRVAGTTGWTDLATNWAGLSFTDTSTDLRRGGLYEYEVERRPIFVALNLAQVTGRGRVVLLVDQTLASLLAPALSRWISDLVGDGWTVLRHDVPRHDDQAWLPGPANSRYQDDCRRIKALVAADYQAQPAATRTVVIVGHVTIPYSGLGAEDGHREHAGAWPADCFYGDLDGQWTDTQVNVASPNPALQNVPGDGKFDANVFNPQLLPSGPDGVGGVELAVGRIDFARLPAFAPRSEADLLRQYLAKNHRYRHKQDVFDGGCLAAGCFSSPYHAESWIIDLNASWLGSRLYGVGSDRVAAGDLFASPTSWLWGLQGGYGGFDAINNNRDVARSLGVDRRTTAELARPDYDLKTAFLMLKGSYFGDWNLDNDCFLRAVLGTPTGGLGAVFTLNTLWRFESAAVGDALLGGVVRTARGDRSVRTSSFFGDPTLRLFVTAPPTQLTAREEQNGVRLDWTASPEGSAGYEVYRSTGGLEGQFARLTPVPLPTSSFRDDRPPAGRKLYQVRALRLVANASGAFTNNSQGVFVTAD
jgi:hypothetical protein